MALTPPPPIPQRSDRATFSPRVDAYLTWEGGTLVPELNQLEANLSSIAAGGAFSIPFVKGPSDSSGKVNTDPNVSQNATSVLGVNNLSSNGISVLSQLQQFDSSTSVIKGQIRLQKLNDTSKWIVFNVNSRSPSGNFQLFNVSVVAASSANPFIDGDSLILFFQRTGDKGEVGSGYYNLLGQATVTTPVSTIDFLNIFNSQYDRYVIELQGVSHGAGDSLVLRLAKASSPDTSSVYIAARGDAVTTVSANSTLVQLCNNSSANVTVTVDVRNANATSGIKPIGVRGVNYDVGASNYSPIIKEGAYLAANAVSGFRIFWQGGGNVTGGTVRVYGVKNSA